ncbi:hypothetical protein DHD05_12485 [Arenibacter sp. N53]|uniref:BACON domain-containing protein n=1 Tax=Arenibacter TaxID=178469 RepID=UPI000CD3DDB3|nr:MULTISPECIES: hypothetical protein [Arenibacter]MCM4152411.1 hypothetical protein [Arenibacter sp. N53]
MNTLKGSLGAIFFLFYFMVIISGCSSDSNENMEVESAILLSPKSLTLSENSSGTLTLSIVPSRETPWEISSKPDWIFINSLSGTFKGEAVSLYISPITEGLGPGEYDGIIKLTSNGLEAEANVILRIGEKASMSLSESSLSFGYFEDEKSFYVKNEGNVVLDWSATLAESYFSIIPQNSNLAPGDSVMVNAVLDRSSLPTTIHELDLSIISNRNQIIKIPVAYKNYKEEKWLISGEVVDAEFDRINDQMIVVSTGPNEIRKIDPLNQSMETLQLNITPTCLSVSQDGNFAVVGHDARVSYIDLNTMQLLNIFDVATDVFDIVLAPNNWAYAFPRSGQWQRIHCVDMTNGTETISTGNQIREGTKAKLHPSGNFIYGSDNGVSPSDVEKYDINAGTAHYLYDSPYHGDYSFDGDIWMSDAGDKLFSRSRNIFKLSEDQATDIRYNGQLMGNQKISTLDIHTVANKICAVMETGTIYQEVPSNIINIFDAEYHGNIGTILLPGYLVPDGTGDGSIYDSEAHFGFFNNAGTAFYSLLKAPEEADLASKWSLATVLLD